MANLLFAVLIDPKAHLETATYDSLPQWIGISKTPVLLCKWRRRSCLRALAPCFTVGIGTGPTFTPSASRAINRKDWGRTWGRNIRKTENDKIIKLI